MLIEIVFLTVLLEIITCIGRFAFKIRARDWKPRIHHGYIGILLLGAYFFIPNEWLAIIGASLILSDASHHFAVLPLTVGSTEFP